MNVQTLINILQLVQPGLAQKEIIQQSNCFVFSNDRVMTYNDEIAISHPLVTDINGAVLANELFSLLTKTKEAELDIIQTDQGLSIKGGKFKASITIASEITLPVDEISEYGVFAALPKDFTKALKFCLFSCSKDMTKPALTCVHVIDDVMEASDNFRITVRYFDSTYFAQPVLIPSNVAKVLSNFDVVEYSSNKGWLHFKTSGQTVFSCRTFENIIFPDVSQFVDTEEGEVIHLPKDLADVLSRAGIFSGTKFHTDERVKVIITPGKLTVKARGDAGWFEEFSRIKYKGEEKKFEVHPEFLSYIFELCDSMEIGEYSLRFEGKEEEFVHVVSLLM